MEHCQYMFVGCGQVLCIYYTYDVVCLLLWIEFVGSLVVREHVVHLARARHDRLSPVVLAIAVDHRVGRW